MIDVVLQVHAMVSHATLVHASPPSGHVLAAPSSPPAGNGGGGVQLPNPPAQLPGNVGNQVSTWIGWAKGISEVAGVFGLICCAVMMIVGRRNRSHIAGEGASGLIWVVGGLSVAMMAVPLVTSVFGD